MTEPASPTEAETLIAELEGMAERARQAHARMGAVAAAATGAVTPSQELQTLTRAIALLKGEA